MKSRYTPKRIFAMITILLFALILSVGANYTVALANDVGVFLGGEIVGFEIDYDGLMITGFDFVETDSGLVKLKSSLKIGDIIRSVDGIKVDGINDLDFALNRAPKKERYSFKVERNGENNEIVVCPLIEKISGEYKIGVNVTEQIHGIGTLTFTTSENNFASLGHLLGENCSNLSGKVYDCVVFGVTRQENSGIGAIKGALNKNCCLGEINCNNHFGVYGEMENHADKEYKLAKINEISVGKAQLCSTISGKKEFYEVQISKINHKDENREKAFTIKVTDDKLIDVCGGIVQGMSGSPIIQNGKIVGALTHVFVSDNTMGYGIYAQTMLNRIE